MAAVAAPALAVPDWEVMAEAVGTPAPRIFSQKMRLFGALAPVVHLWHDSAAWHPFCNQVWLLLEEMRLPHMRGTIPLDQYMKPGENLPPEFTRLGLRANIPIVQLASKSSRSNESASFGPPLREGHAVDIFRRLHQLFPEHALLPRTQKRRAFAEALFERYSHFQSSLYALLGSRRDPQTEARYRAAMDELDGAWSGKAGGRLSLRAWGDDGDGDAARFGGPIEGGPFLFGERPCAVDVLLLPMLERCEANVPHPMIGMAPHLSLDRWPALARMLAAARVPGTCAYGELGSDPKTVVGIRLGVTGQIGRLPALNPRHAADEAAASAPECRRDAAARLCSNHVAVARFACSGSGVSRARQDAQSRPAPTPATLGATDDALRAVADLLLRNGTDASQLLSAGRDASVQIQKIWGAPAAGHAAAALLFLAENTGVPRDMNAGPGHAFRSHLGLMSASLHSSSPHSRR